MQIPILNNKTRITDMAGSEEHYRGILYVTRYESTGRKDDHLLEHELSRRLLITGLREFGGIECPEGPVFVKNEFGKPFLKDYPEIYFNISHCKGVAACAVGSENMGLDVEGVRPFSDLLLRKVLSKEEQERFLTVKNREEVFFRYWTLKEAYVKYIGKGLGFPLNKVGVYPGVAEYDSFTEMDCDFCQWRLTENYIVSVCSKVNNWTENGENEKWIIKISETGGSCRML